MGEIEPAQTPEQAYRFPRGNGPQEVRHVRRRPRWALIATAAVILVLAVVVIISAVLRGHDTTRSASGSRSGQIIASAPTGAPTAQEQPKQLANTTAIPGVLAWDTQGWPGDGSSHAGALEHQHVTGPVTYAVVPPVGGPHNATWMNAGVYTKPVPTERAVHNLEHGAVWITYDPNLPASQIATLTKFVGAQSMIPESQQGSGIANQANRYMDLSPWATNTLPSPIVLSSWGYQLRVTSPTDPRMQQFVNTFRNSSTYSPEYGSAMDGVPVQTGGRPALDGSRQPNPPGSA
jgi:Protein of unknown function (DUF3105)